LQVLMLPHLEEEERVLCPVLREKFSEKEEAVIVQRILDDMGKDKSSKELPVIILAAEEWGGPAVVSYLWGMLPGPVRFLCRKFWIPDALDNNLGLLKSVMDQQSKWKKTPHGCCSCCAIL